ncbi:MAG: multiple sugar transport system permease protein [Sphaerochaeta sp.]|jgi:multiple sugar transport system permease protein|uniref:sn-glycerol-3-phosphate transport system permease protein UgpE n=1 Tax=Sphaerochaeta halotolerans TaxID=2293840 RepID=A0A372MFW5_9SPIR|nr:carbohydrate ABC transporter permease [Sphaerochaeta halotolerans]MBG0767845.1 carbohydrate ABC transporter permease [Spirochaetaceae bacterium]MDK2860225.1 multiple sugar transport system permease protein [Sphaerochaeta sp.]MDN5334703.1 multiple sugar transport system permease protein [Sphaerochaeta sp.]RFU94691.1 carbohydrate ABC transporter permease [Sphaerochaeta halotolerans]
MQISKKINVTNIVIWIVLAVMLLFTMTPIIFMISASMMERNQIMRMPFSWIPESFNRENFIKAVAGNDQSYIFVRNLSNSLFVSSTVAITTVLIASLTGYGLAKFRFRGRNTIFIMIMATMMIPFEAIMIPLYMVVMMLRIQNTYTGLILPFLVSAFGVFQMRQYLTTFPTEFLDAARVDGMGEFGIYWRIVLPNCMPVIATLSILSFRSQWDNLLWPLLVSQTKEMKTIPQYISTFALERNTDEGAMMAAALLASIPMFILFMSLTKYFIGGAAIYESRKG